MRVLVVAYHAPPEITPRAFRVGSLVAGLRKAGCEVDLIVPPKPPRHADHAATDARLRAVLRQRLSNACRAVLPGGGDLRALPFFLEACRGRRCDLLISVGLPFSVHLATALARRYLGLSATSAVADYGDPFSYPNPGIRACFYAPPLERWVLEQFDFVSVPTEGARQAFRGLKAPEAIRVIPQSCDIAAFRTAEYRPHRVPTFGYAGVFYKGIRNPTPILEHLAQTPTDFRLVLYTDLSHVETSELLRPYQARLQDRLEVRRPIPREDCIYELSKLDFLVNFANTSEVQAPSKLVDYALTGRPFLTVKGADPSFGAFDAFLAGNYAGAERYDARIHDERVVTRQFLDLATRAAP
jgi:hypothetical protein